MRSPMDHPSPHPTAKKRLTTRASQKSSGVQLPLPILTASLCRFATTPLDYAATANRITFAIFLPCALYPITGTSLE